MVGLCFYGRMSWSERLGRCGIGCEVSGIKRSVRGEKRSDERKKGEVGG